MNKNQKGAIIAILVVALIGVSALSIYSAISVNGDHQSMKYMTAVTHQVNHDGVWGPVIYDGHNLVVNYGLNWTMGRLFGVPSTGVSPITVIALGNLSNVTEGLLFLNNTASNQAIADCSLTPTNVTSPIYVSNQNISLSAEWTSSCSGLIVNTTALYNQTGNASNIMFAGKNFSSSVTLQSGDKLNVTWYVWVTSG